MSHHLFATKIEKDVEAPLRSFHAKREMQGIQTIQGNLQGMAKELDDAQKKSDTLSKKAGKTSAAKMDQAASRLESATSQWESQAPFIFETLQALDETRVNQLRDVMTQYGTYEGEQAQQKQAEAEGVLNSLLDYQTAAEIQHFAARTTAGKPPRTQGRTPPTATPTPTTTTATRQGSISRPATAAPTTSPALIADDDRSEHSAIREEKGGENKLRSRIGTMLGRRRQSIHGGFGQLSPSKSPFGSVPFGRNVKSSHGASSPRTSSTNLGESNRLSSLAERPDSAGEAPRPSEAQEQDPHEGTNGTGGDAAIPEPSHVNGTTPKVPDDVDEVPPPAGAPPAQNEPEKDADGFTVPSATNDPISAAQREALGVVGEEGEPAFKLNIQKEPVADEDPEERQAALSNFSNSLSALGLPARRTGTVRGRRDVRNTIYVPAPLPEMPATGSNPLAALAAGGSSLSKPPPVAALASETSVAGTSDTQSIRSSNSLSSVVQFKHPDMHEPGLNSSVMETIVATFEGGEAKSVKVNGEIAFSFNPTDPSNPQSKLAAEPNLVTCRANHAAAHLPIRINNFPLLEVIGPNRIFVSNHTPDQPDQFTLDVSHLRQNQATVGFSYRVHVEPTMPPVELVPLLLHPVWKQQGDKLGLLMQYKLNPAFKFAEGGVTLHNVVIFATYEGKASGAQTKPSGTHLKDKHLIYWRLGDMALDSTQSWQKIVCRIVGEAGVEPKPGTVEARWEFNSPSEVSDAIGVSRLEESKGKEVELSDDDPFADAGTQENGAEGRWVDVPATRKIVSGKYEAPS
jgi:F-BAR domain only protein